MAEWLPSNSSSNVNVHDPVTSQPRLAFQTGTYIVQVPMDQIYLVPAPENAKQHRNPEAKKEAYRCYSQLCCFIFIVIVVISIALTLGFSFSLLKPKNPEFKVQRLAVKAFAKTCRTS
ncbi:hypothetical protein MANES_02G154102v8 [Manihot esculenta]|uniref:Uncharacterized protein n=1 Tax=Manihot esculenta TaxID=3983 RepID=A0ACB7I7L4_MANES|nr:hypothetical protein MANES_02G154102v8 [Manihot esculenta]